MKRWIGRIGLVAALGFLVLTFVNASWLAPAPRGYPRLIAEGGAAPQPEAKAGGPCAAMQIESPLHLAAANTLSALHEARRLGAQMVAIDLRQTADGHLVLLRDDDLACQTGAAGSASRMPLAQIKALDAGYGFTADGGKTFPLRGKGVGQIATAEEAIAATPETALLFTLRGDDPATADRLVSALSAAGRDPAARRDGFSGSPPVLARLRAAFPRAWAYSDESAAACGSAYGRWGWLGIVPEACRNGTLTVPVDRQWLVPGWPNHTLARMADAGARVVVTGPAGSGRGIDLPEQLGDIPLGFNGYIRAADIDTIGPALRPAFNKRNPVDEAALARALDARRQARD